MPEYRAPGVYVEEIQLGPRPIEGVPTSTAAFLGEAERGPIKPHLVTSFKDYQRWFGGVFDETRYLPYAVSGFFENGGKRLYVCRVVGKQATAAEAEFGADFVVRAVGPGSWGRRVWVVVSDSTAQTTDAGGNKIPVGFRIRLGYWPGNQQPFDFVAEPARTPRPVVVEDFDDLVTDETSPDFYGRRFPYIDLAKGDTNQGPDSSALAILVRSATAPANARPANGSALLATNGTDDANALGVDDYVGLAAGTRSEIQGLSALELDPYREVALVYAPAAGTDVARSIVAHCEKVKFRFAVIDAPRGVDSASALDPRTTIADTQYAAFYYPWIWIADPQTGARKLVPPGGHALGVYARTDIERGVFKAPANEIVRGALDLEYDIDDETQGVLNPRGVNVIRRFPGRGIRLWGARTLSSDASWKYVNVRRLFIFLERSIYEGTQWVVFEPNDPGLWARVTSTIQAFLLVEWRRGALLGRTNEEAFFVKCDATTMTQDDVLNGRLICEIGIAVLRPAEFVIFRIFQHTAEAQR